MTEVPVTVVVHRRVKSDRDIEFRAAMHEFADAARDVPGHLGMQLLLPPTGGHDYTVIAKFSDRAAREAFTASSAYQARMRQLAELTEGDPRIHELSGLEGWFASGNTPTLPRPPKFKMAVATFFGVFPVTTLLGLALGPPMAGLPFLLRNAVFSVLVVAILTWLLMPLITRLLHRWLFADPSSI